MLPKNDHIKSEKEFAGVAMELQEHEIKSAIQLVYLLQAKYSHLPNNAANLEKLRDEALTRLAEMGILATLDPAPCLYGEPPTLEIIGRVGDFGFQKETDHEKKGWGVKKAVERGEEYLGQSGGADATKAKKRNKKRK